MNLKICKSRNFEFSAEIAKFYFKFTIEADARSASLH